MGIEYSIKFDPFDQRSAEKVLIGLSSPELTIQDGYGFHYWKTAPTEGMSDATASIESDGLYFNDHGGFGPEILGRLVTQLVSKFGVITVQEYEP